jgi:hypothetical protein
MKFNAMDKYFLSIQNRKHKRSRRNDSVWYPMLELDWSWADGREETGRIDVGYERRI